MKLFYEGVEITPRVSINRCVTETFAENRADRLFIRFNDAAGLWDKWSPKRGDKIQFNDEAADTGAMFVREIRPENGLLTIIASSAPLSCDTVNSRTWEGIRLFKLCTDIAERHGLTFKPYGLTDQIYSYIQQENMTDLEFLNRRCQLEGAALVIYDGNLVVYDEHAREEGLASGQIRLGVDAVFEFNDRSAEAFGSVEIINGRYRGQFTDPNGPQDRVLRPAHPIECSSNTEALRFARSLLRAANKNAVTGSVRRPLERQYAAGSVLELVTEKAPSWGGKIFVTRTRHDFLTGETKIFFRKPLEGY